MCSLAKGCALLPDGTCFVQQLAHPCQDGHNKTVIVSHAGTVVKKSDGSTELAIHSQRASIVSLHT